MKIHLVDGALTATAQTHEDVLALLTLVPEEKEAVETAKAVPEKKNRRRGNKRTCEKCGRSCKGTIGLGLHKRKVHGIWGKTAVEAEERRARVEAKKKRVIPVEDLSSREIKVPIHAR